MFCSRCGTEVQTNAKFCPSCGLDLALATPHATRAAQAAAGVGADVDAAEKSDTEIVKDALRAEYDVLEELGRGGMAIVFKARDRQLDRLVALKVLPFSLAFDSEFVERFQREARTAARLEHPNIIPIYRVGKTGRVIFFVMKLLRGQSLSSIIEDQGAMPPDEIRQLLIETAKALGYAHKHDIVHRDIKPDNIMYDELGHAIVTDFGIAKAATGTKLTGTGMSIGTPHYMSPEQARANPLDGRSDIYSLGVVAYQCLTGHVPFDGEDSFSIGYKHIMEEVPIPPLQTVEQEDLFVIIRRMMAKAPDDRFQDAGQLVEALEGGPSVSTAKTMRFRAGDGATQPRAASALATASGALVTSPTTPTTPIPRADPPAPPAKKRSGALAGLLTLFVLGGGGAGGFYYYHNYMRTGFPVSLLPEAGRGAPVSDTLGGDSLSRAGADSTAALTDTTADDSIVASLPGDSGTVEAEPLPDTGVLTMTGVPVGARVRIDGEFRRGNPLTVDPGSHKVEVLANGYENFVGTVNVRRGGETTLAVSMIRVEDPEPEPPTPASTCSAYGTSYNRDGSCFDQRPVPKAAPLVPLSPEIQGRPTDVILVIKVSPAGQAETVQIKQRSDSPQFTLLAVDFARRIAYNPAQKGGRPVAAYFEQVFRPGRRP